jgi:perosamine synthetase
MYGQSCDIEPIIKIAKKHNLYTISDTAQAIGSKVKNKYTGTLTDIGGFQFQLAQTS